MKLSEHTEIIRVLIDTAFRNRLGRMGINEGALLPIHSIPSEYHQDRSRMESIREVFIAETGTVENAYEKLVEELTFTLFNRLAALKVMEAHTLHPEIITRREAHGGRSFAHLAWLELHPEARSQEAEELITFMEDQLTKLSEDIPLFSLQYPYHLLPTSLELSGILKAFNQVETDIQVDSEIWKSDDVLGWLYESYNNYKKAQHKDSGAKTEYNKVSIQSQVYTPRWVVKFLVDNSLGKLYLEMYPDSLISNKYKIASIQGGAKGNITQSNLRKIKPLHEIRLIDPSSGSGNILLYSFDLFYDLYKDQIEHYGADYDITDVPGLIIRHNLHGIDLDDRSAQLAQLGLYIKAKRKKRTTKIEHFNVVSSDFYLPEYKDVKYLFENGQPLDPQLEKIVMDLWDDLQQAYKFGSLIRLEEEFTAKLNKLIKKEENTFFMTMNEGKYESFRENFFSNLQKAMSSHTASQGQTFLNTKTQDAITFLELLTQKYDVAVANPPYTDSADFGPELKAFIDLNYKQPIKFNTNLYASFIKRCYEMVAKGGKIAMVHPPTFMYIKTFEDVRKFMIEKTHISLFVEWGYLGMFHPSARVDSAMYILEKKEKQFPSQFIKLNDIYEGKRYEVFVQAYDDLIAALPNAHNISLPQEKLKIIEGGPFIYWISDGFREKFKDTSIGNVADVRAGIQTSNNDRFLRYWWEIDKLEILGYTDQDFGQKRWVIYAKGGPFVTWAGNLWLVIDWKNEGKYLESYLHSVGQDLHAKEYYYREGITGSVRGSKGPSFRHLPSNTLFDIGGTAIFLNNENFNLYYLLAVLNSKLAFYVIECLNPTVNVQPSDLKRIPFVLASQHIVESISFLSGINVEIKNKLISFRIYEAEYKNNPLVSFSNGVLRDRLITYLNFENVELAKILINEAIINELIYHIYDLSQADREQVEAKMGNSIGSLPIMKDALLEFETVIQHDPPDTNAIILEHLTSLPLIEFAPDKKREIIDGFSSLYHSNNDLEEFCIRHQFNPINAWYWFKESRVLPSARASEIILEFLTDTIRTLLHEDADGIIPLVALPGEPHLAERLEQYCLENGFTAAQYMQLDSLLGRPVNEYLEHHFFKDLSDHLNLFMYLPKTPFIWHLSSGEHQGFEAYILIYKWNRDSLFKLKAQYISQRVQNLDYRRIQLQDVHTAQAQNEKEKIRLQLKEIEVFIRKIDELITEGYDPKLDDGVGKNIAPLQKKGMLRAEVLKSQGKNSQLEKYLHADW